MSSPSSNHVLKSSLLNLDEAMNITEGRERYEYYKCSHGLLTSCEKEDDSKQVNLKEKIENAVDELYSNENEDDNSVLETEEHNSEVDSLEQSLPECSYQSLVDGRVDYHKFQKLTNFSYIDPSLNVIGNYNIYVYQSLLSITKLASVEFSEIIETKAVYFPSEQGDKKTLILDLDETLVHADFNRTYSDHDIVVTFNYEGEEVEVPVFLRPGVLDFLNNVSRIFEVVIFTASIKEYADSVLNYLDPENKVFATRLYRDSCINIQNKFCLKDLTIVKNRRLEDIVLLDNSIFSFANHLSNGILINSYYNDKNDSELSNVFSYLEAYIEKSKDVRIVNEGIFNFQAICDEFKKNNEIIHSS